MLMDLQELLKVNDHLNRCTSCVAVFYYQKVRFTIKDMKMACNCEGTEQL